MTIWPFSTLTDAHRPVIPYLVAAWFACLIPAIAITAVLQAVLPPEMLEAVNSAVIDDAAPLWLQFVLIIVAAPIIETALMVVVFSILGVLRTPIWLQIIIQAIGWGILHGAIAFAWGFAVTWLFFIFALVYVTQRQRSTLRAFWMTSAVHGLNNATASLGLIVELAT
ncbi:MAG: hypothetical protein AAGH41_00735 [Pseudomonadota bacterium]